MTERRDNTDEEIRAAMLAGLTAGRHTLVVKPDHNYVSVLSPYWCDLIGVPHGTPGQAVINAVLDEMPEEDAE